MTPLRLALLAFAGLTATACASAPRPVATPVVDQGAPAPLADHDWSLGEENVLRYGRDQSGDVWFALACDPGSKRLDMVQWSHAVDERVIALESGGDSERWPATVEADEMSDGQTLNASAPMDHPVFQRFRRVGWLASWGPEGRVMMAAQPGSTQGIERFFAACG